jgi:ATP-dependent RNA helicase SUPV3L1/SUV3
VAPDAIGMGLNMELGHVAFASVRKFAGREDRRLSAPEVAQIAGRAGRHMANGTFGTTNGCEPLDDRLIEAVESHSFPPLKALRWRSSDLDFRSLLALQHSLEAPPPASGLVRTRDALDDRSLAMLAGRDAVRARATGQERVRLLWQVCQIPDFRKTLTDAHLNLLATVYHHVTTGRGQLPNDWVGRMIAGLDRVDGDIDTLVTRIAHVRTWTYLSHRDDWLDDPRHWQERGREVEDRLSDALHERLAQRFVDRRTSSLMRSLREEGVVATSVEDDGEVVVDGHGVGLLDGLRFTPVVTEADIERRVLSAAARRAVLPELQRRATAILRAEDDAFHLDEEDRIVWQGAVIARLEAGDDLLRPRLRLLANEELGAQARSALEQRLGRWLVAWIGRRLGPLRAIADAASGDELGGPGRGIAFVLAEALGSARRTEAESLIVRLDDGDRRRLTRLGVRLGRLHLYVPKLLKPAAVEARARLWRIARGRSLPLPEPGWTVLRPSGGMDAMDGEAALAMGFAPFAAFALRQDVAERLAAAIRGLARSSARFELPVALGAQAGLTREELQMALGELGYRAREDETTGRSGWVLEPRRRRHAAQARPERRPPGGSSPFAALAALKLAT